MVFGFGRRGKGAKKSWGCRKGRGGPPSHCVCPACGTKLPHVPGQPCFKRLCPECGSPMTRQLVEEDH